MASAAEPAQTNVEQTPVQKWTMELTAAEKFFEDFHKQGKKVVERYIDERKEDSTPWPTSRLNLFHANVVTMRAMMYAKLPKVEADRRFADPNDAVARVAGEMVTRILQNDMNREDNDLKTVLQHVIDDRLVPGLGTARVKYCCEDDKDKVVATVEGEDEPLYAKKDEWCEEVYVHWRDILWSPARTYQELRWIAYRTYLTRDEVKARFGAKRAAEVSFTSKGPETLRDGGVKPVQVEAAPQAEVWEIWDKASKQVLWWARGAQDLLDQKDDPLKLVEFFPSAIPMIANATTSRFIPKADFVIAQDIYNRIDQLETRIGLLLDSCKAVGVYAGDSEGVKNMLTEGIENQLIPVDNWALWAERGGLKGMIEWFPIQAVAEVIGLLTQQQQIWIQKLYQVTGMSDIMRGQASAAGTTATEQKIKAQFGSVRISALQDEFAAFTQDLLNKKVQLIRRFYDAERIVALSNILQTPEAQKAQQAIQLIKDPDNFDLRISIKADSMAAVDMEALKQERTEFIQGMAQIIGQSAPLIQQQPDALPFVMQLMKFSLAGYKASSEMEGILDQFIAKAQQELAQKAQNPQPSPEEKKAQMESQMMQQEFQMKAQESQQSAQLDQQKAMTDIQMKREEFELEKQKMQMELMFKQRELEMQEREMQMKLSQQAQQGALDMQVAQQKADQDLALGHQKATLEARRADAEEDRAEVGFWAEQKRADHAAKAEAKRAPKEPK